MTVPFVMQRRGTPAPPADDRAAAERHVRDVVARSGTSFLAGMKVLPEERRRAMFAIYAFCREIDDVADEPGATEEKLRRLAAWRADVERIYDGEPESLTARALLDPVAHYALRREDFLALIDGMEMDAREAMRGPTMDALELYCDRVACAVGRLSVRVFGAPVPQADAVAFALGQALQLTNILRDLAEDAERGRLYLPAELLRRHGIDGDAPHAVLADPALPAVCGDLAEVAERRFGEAVEALRHCPPRPMRPAIVMMHVYHRILRGLRRRGWRDLDRPVGPGKLTKLWIVLRYGLLAA